MKGDTVFIEKWRSRYIDKYHTDSIRVKDSVYVNRTDTIEVPRQFTRTQNLAMRSGYLLWIILLILITIGVYKVIRLIKK